MINQKARNNTQISCQLFFPYKFAGATKFYIIEAFSQLSANASMSDA